MAVEAKRGCGYRRVGGLYLRSGKLGRPCHLMPHPLHVCPTCHGGIKATRGWTWVGKELLPQCGQVPKRGALSGLDCLKCPICCPPVDRFGLLFVGAEHYATAEAFAAEAKELGISRRIPRLPKGFKLGETWVLVAHRKGAEVPFNDEAELPTKWVPAIVSCFKPTAVELIVRASEATAAKIAEEAERGVTVVAVPDGDPDHDPKGPKQQRELALPDYSAPILGPAKRKERNNQKA